ncbi:MAG: radical SAM protein [Deltaproteobacteria bacterium]|nr:radical SAM protein [Deltaproteobacteria bacterium]
MLRAVAAPSDVRQHQIGSDSVYGPVRSRRYGLTLGVNVLPPDRKACRYSCAYCQLGHSRGLPPDDAYPAPGAIREALERAARADFEAIVICGNGEPTLHPAFAAVVEEILRLRDERFGGRPVVCLTSGSELHRHDVVEALRRLDEASVKLDAGRCSTLRRVAVAPTPVCVDWLTWKIRSLGGAVVQTCFIDGPVTNSTDEEVEAWIGAILEASPRRVDVYTIDRPPPSAHVRAVTSERLEQIATRLRRGANVPVRVVT